MYTAYNLKVQYWFNYQIFPEFSYTEHNNKQLSYSTSTLSISDSSKGHFVKS